MRHLGYTAVVLLVATLAACSGQGSASSNSGATPAAEATVAIVSTATPNASLVAAATAAASPGVAVKTVRFSDINGIFAEQAIRDLAALGVFETTSGAFGPSRTISRALFVRWLVKADNVFHKDPAHQIRLAEDKVATFVDVPSSQPDFKYVQGLANSGYVVGIDAKHFQPDRPITREEMVAIKAQVDEGATITPVDLMYLSQFGDANKVNKRYTGAIHEDFSVRTTHNIGRVYGNIKMLQPQKPVTRAEAAIALSVIADTSAAVALGRTPAP
jgi:hypothetical protein